MRDGGKGDDSIKLEGMKERRGREESQRGGREVGKGGMGHEVFGVITPFFSFALCAEWNSLSNK